MYAHLAGPCKNVPESVKQLAREQIVARRVEGTKRKAAKENVTYQPHQSEPQNSPDTVPPSPHTQPLANLSNRFPLGPPPLKRSRTEPFSQPRDQASFETDLLHVFVQCNIAWNAAENPELRQFFGKWIPGMVVPSRRVLSSRVLDAEAERVQEAVHQRVKGQMAVGQCDGWKSVAKEAINATSMTVEGVVRGLTDTSLLMLS